MKIILPVKKSLLNFKFLLLVLSITQISCSTKQSTVLVITDDKNTEILNKGFTLFEKSTRFLHKEFYFIAENLEDTVFNIKVNNKLVKYSVPEEGLSIINLTAEDLIASRRIYQTRKEKFFDDLSYNSIEEIHKRQRDSVEKSEDPDYQIKHRREPKDMALLQPNSITILNYGSHNFVYGLNKTMPNEIKSKENITKVHLYYKIYSLNDFNLELSKSMNLSK